MTIDLVIGFLFGLTVGSTIFGLAYAKAEASARFWRQKNFYRDTFL